MRSAWQRTWLMLLVTALVGGCTILPDTPAASQESRAEATGTGVILPTVLNNAIREGTMTPQATIQAKTQTAERPYIVLAYDDTGDFGPNTPGTRTAGWQEALDYAVEHKMDLYVKGGYGGMVPIYHVSETIHFPPAQDFRVDGGIYVINWTGPQDQDLLVIDSAMNCEYHFGILVYGGHGAAMRVKPERPVPIDGFPIVVETVIHSQGMADPHPFTPGERTAGTGLVFEGTRAPIVHNTFRFFGVLNFQTVIRTQGNFANNHLEVLHLHTNAHKSTLFNLGQSTVANTMWLAIGVDQGATDVTGIVVYGKNNKIDLLPRPSRAPFPDGRMLVFDLFAEGNQVNVISQEPFDPHKSITDRAVKPTNQVTWTGGPAPIHQVEVTPGHFTYVQRLYPATARISGGAVSGLTLARNGQTVDYSATPNADILLSVADELRIESTEAPTLYIIPLKVQ